MKYHIKPFWTKGANICFIANEVQYALMNMGPNGPIKYHTIQELTDYWE